MKSNDILNSFEDIVVDGKTYNVSQMSLKELNVLKQDIQKMKEKSIKACEDALNKLEIKEDTEEDNKDA